METLLGKIYCLFESLFGQHLAEYLWGYNCETQVYDNKNLFNVIGLITISLTVLFVIGYYYLPCWLFNHPRSNRWWNWLIILVVAGIINFFIAYGWTINDFLNGMIGDCLMYVRDSEGNIVAQLIYQSDCLLFGVANFLVTILVFILSSLLIKWWSRNCKYSPFIIS